MFVPCFVIQYFVSFWFCNHLDWEERAGCFVITFFLMSCDSQCSVALPYGAVGWSVLCACGIPLSYALLLVKVCLNSVKRQFYER